MSRLPPRTLNVCGGCLISDNPETENEPDSGSLFIRIRFDPAYSSVCSVCGVLSCLRFDSSQGIKYSL